MRPNKKWFTIYLFRGDHFTRNWRAYIHAPEPERATVVIKVKDWYIFKAKQQAITIANKGFRSGIIVSVNYTDPQWGINNYPDLVEKFGKIALASEH